MSTLRGDLRYAVRKLARSPGFTAVAVLTLALGIGANSAIFSVVNAVLLRPLNYEDPEGLVMVWERNVPRNQHRNVVASVNFAAWREQNRVFEDMAAMFGTGATLIEGGDPERIQAAVVSPNFFQILRAAPQHGRVFLPEEGETANAQVVVLSHGFWQRRYAGSTDVVGRTLSLSGDPHTIVGVMPASFKGVRFGSMSEKDLWAPLPWAWAQGYRGRAWMVVARLRPGVPLEGAQAEMSTIASRLEQEHDYNDGWGVNVVPLREQVVGDVRLALLVLLSAVGFVLLIACANVANLSLARASSRQKEFAIRSAIGAGRGRIMRQLLTESSLLAVLGGGAGLLLGVWGVDLMIALSPGDIPRTDEIGVSGSVLLFTLLVSVLAGALFGLAPALQASRSDLQASLREGSRGSSAISGRRLRSALVVTEMALAVVLLIGAGLVIRSFWKLNQVDPGFDADNVLSVRVALPGSAYPEEAEQVAFFGELLGRVETSPGVASAAATIALPLSGGLAPGTSFIVEGRPEPPRAERPVADIRAVTPGYFRTMGTRLLRGRGFTDRDEAESPMVIVVSETLARNSWPGEDPIGKRLSVSWDGMISSEVIGVVADVRHNSLDAVPRGTIYYAYPQFPIFSFMNLVVRSSSDPTALVTSIRREVSQLDADLPVYNVTTMRELVEGSVADERFNMLLLGLFAALALLLASIGIYGVISYSVTQRTHEIGIRVALGAEQARVLRLVIQRGMGLAVAGVVIGLGAALGLTRLMASLLFEVSGTDPLTFSGVALLLLSVALAACYVPASRATRIDPVTALRSE